MFAALILLSFLIEYYYVGFPRRTDDLYFYVPYMRKKVTAPDRGMTGILYDYQGLYDLFFNLFTLILVVSFVLEKTENRVANFLLFVLLFLCVRFEIPKNQIWFDMNFLDEPESHYYHFKLENMDVVNQVIDYATKEGNLVPIMASQICSGGVLINRPFVKVKDNVFSYELNEMSDKAILQRILYRYEPGLPEIEGDYIQDCPSIEDREVEYMILGAKYKWNLETGAGYWGGKIMKIDNCRVFKIHYDWLKVR